MTYEQIYDSATRADEAFHAECVRQFGKAAGDKRYLPRLHDERTASAANAFQVAMAELRRAWGRA